MNSKTILSLSYILSYFALGLSIYNHIFMSLILYFISATMLGLVIFNSKFTHKSNRFILLALALLQELLIIRFTNNIIEISYSLLISLVWQAAYSLLYLYTFNLTNEDTKMNVTKLIITMNIALITILLIVQAIIKISNPTFNILSGYWDLIIIVSLLSFGIVTQIKFNSLSSIMKMQYKNMVH